MQEMLKEELTKYKDILLENDISDLENLKGKRLRKALNLIKKHKRSRENSVEISLDQEILRKIRHFL